MSRYSMMCKMHAWNGALFRKLIGQPGEKLNSIQQKFRNSGKRWVTIQSTKRLLVKQSEIGDILRRTDVYTPNHTSSLDIWISNLRLSRTDEQRNHVTWSKGLNANNPLSRFSVLNWQRAQTCFLWISCLSATVRAFYLWQKLFRDD